MKIQKLIAREILNSAGKISIEVKLFTPLGVFISASPSGTSSGKHEVKFDIKKSIKMLNKMIVPEINSIEEIFELEKKFEKNQINTLPLIYALIKALAFEKAKQPWELFNVQLPSKVLMFNKIVGGGLHARALTKFQEFLVCPISDSFDKNLEIAYDIHKSFGEEFEVFGRDLEGGWVTRMTTEEILEALNKKINEAKIKYKVDILLGVDVAASSFFKNKKYGYNSKKLDTNQQIEYISDLIEKYNIYYIEDPFNEEDFDSFKILKNKFPNKMICGDDLTVTSIPLFMKAIKKDAINSIIVKPNQVGYIYKTKELCEIAKKYKVKTIISHRSQETNDDTLSDMCIGLNCDFMKIGLFGGERVAKLNRLKEILR